MKKKKLALLGYGYLNGVVADAVKDGILPEYEIVGVMGRNPEKVSDFAKRYNCKACNTIEEIMDLKPDFVAEAASPETVVDYAETVLKNGANIIILSAGAFADLELYEKLKQTAIENNTKIYLPGGAVGGFDLLRTASLRGPIDITITSEKTPRSLNNAPFFKKDSSASKEPERVFTGNVKRIMEEYPQIYNVAMATSLASAGPEDTKLNINTAPNLIGDDYNIHLKGEDMEVDLTIKAPDYNIAAWSVVGVLKNAVSPVVF